MTTDKALIAHLYRRAGFGITHDKLEELSQILRGKSKHIKH